MIVRGLDQNYDWQFGRGLANYKAGIDAVRQNIMTRIKSWKGNCFFALDDCVDYQNFLDKGTKVFLDNDIKRVVLQTDSVIRIDSYSSEITERDFTANMTVTTIYGQIEIEV